MVDFITPSSIDIRANDAVASNTAGANGQFLFNTTSNSLHVYDGISIGGYKTSLTISVLPVLPPSAQGSISGYTSGGGISNPVNTIDKFSFSADGNATDVGDLTQSRKKMAGQSSSTHGYTTGGIVTPYGYTDRIDKFPFTSDSNASTVGSLTQARSGCVGNESPVSGYSNGGGGIIDKFPFASDTNAASVGNTLAPNGMYGAGQSSATHGYATGHNVPAVDTIEKFPFSSDTNATDVGELTAANFGGIGTNSNSHGYQGKNNLIEEFSFSSDSSATSVGTMSSPVKWYAAGQSSTTHGYTSGSTGSSATIDKFPFSSGGPASAIGNLTQGRYACTGQQD